MKFNNLIPKISLLLVITVLVATYFILWQQDLSRPAGSYINPLAVIADLILPLCFIPAWIVGIYRSAVAKHYFWLLVQALVFPSVYVYTLFINRGAGANNSFKPNPLRGSA